MRKEGVGATVVEVGEVESIARDPASATGRVVFWVGAVTSVLHIYLNTLSTMSENWTSALHFATFGFLAALIFPLKAARGARGARAVLAADVGFAAATAVSSLYLLVREDSLYAGGVHFNAADWVFSGFAILAAIELTRRATGLVFPILIVGSLSYVVLWGRYVGGFLHFPGLSWEALLYRSYFGGDGMFGPIARISTTYVFMFILFGAFLLRSGAGEFIMDLARCVAGRFVGGPGLVAVVASGLTGTISGSAIANVVSTGVFTIPLMRRAGFSPRFAAAVEAAASTGGQIMPPIMGTGAFVMASYTQIPYLTIAAVSFLPALMYFLSVAFFVRIGAKRLGVVPDADGAPPLREVLRRGGIVFLFPIAVLMGFLVYGFTPTYGAGVGILAVIAASWFTKTPMGPRAILDALATGARNTASTAVMLVAVGLIVNVIGTTGVGNTFSLMISQWAGGSLFVSLVLVALAALVLGLALPVTATYIVLATLSAPALFQLIGQSYLVDAIAAGTLPDAARGLLLLVAPDQAAAIGQPMAVAEAKRLLALVPPESLKGLAEAALDPAALTTALLSAHMIIFWLSQDSNVTPPVCLPAFAAAAIAKAPPMGTGFTAWRLAKGLYIVPVLFAYSDFLSGDLVSSLRIFCVATVGMYGLVGAMEGYLEAPVSWPLRAVLAAAGVVTIWPHGRLWLDLCGVAAILLVLARTIRADRRRAPAPA